MTPLQVCQSIIGNRLLDSGARSFFSGLPEDEKHYWIASLYALLMPKARRRRLAAYFTPPHLAHYAIDTLIEAGIKPGQHRILDPASGGAAFLVPLAARISNQARQRGARGETILRAIESSLAGVEIEPDLATLSKALLLDLLRNEIDSAGRRPTISIQRADTLKLPPPETLYDAAIGNPPYGCIFRPSKTILTAFAPVISDGYVNLYALFLEQTIRWVKPGGVICLIVPMSFVGGPYFTALRKRILEASHVLRLDPREDTTAYDESPRRYCPQFSAGDYRPNRSLTADYARSAGLLLKNAPASGDPPRPRLLDSGRHADFRGVIRRRTCNMQKIGSILR